MSVHTPRNNLQIVTPTGREIVFTRSFDAPRAEVFGAWTDPDAMLGWMSTRQLEMTTCKTNTRPGGKFRYEWSDPANNVIGLNGEFMEVNDARIVHTQSYDDDRTGGPVTVTTVFAEHDGKTTVNINMRCVSTECRNAVRRSPMTENLEIQLDRLATLVSTHN